MFSERWTSKYKDKRTSKALSLSFLPRQTNHHSIVLTSRRSSKILLTSFILHYRQLDPGIKIANSFSPFSISSLAPVLFALGLISWLRRWGKKAAFQPLLRDFPQFSWYTHYSLFAVGFTLLSHVAPLGLFLQSCFKLNYFAWYHCTHRTSGLSLGQGELLLTQVSLLTLRIWLALCFCLIFRKILDIGFCVLQIPGGMDQVVLCSTCFPSLRLSTQQTLHGVSSVWCGEES